MSIVTEPQHLTAERVTEMYEHCIRPQLDPDADNGKVVVFDPETLEFEVDESGVRAARRLRRRHPDSHPIGLRIGFELAIDCDGRPQYRAR